MSTSSRETRERRPKLAAGIPADGLYACWPDAELRRTYGVVYRLYEEAVRAACRKRRPPDLAINGAFSSICERFLNGEFTEELRFNYGADWLQAVASILGMLMHLSLSDSAASSEPYLLHNDRRPGKQFSTYPTAPAVAALAAEHVVALAFRGAAPRVIDPSMESGQLLLAVAEAVLRRVKAPSRPSVLRNLCRNCLWGVDRKPQAAESVAVVFHLLAREYGLELEPPRNLLIENTLHWQAPIEFDAVINNPPWGERMTNSERAWLRCEFAKGFMRGDTYIAFTELAMRLLRPGGAYALVLPAQALSSQNARGIREMLSGETHLMDVHVLPRHAFAAASVRACVLRGVRQAPEPGRTCRTVIYPFRKSLHYMERPWVAELPVSDLRLAGGNSWWALLHSHAARPLKQETVPLETVAAVHLGVQVYSVGEGSPPQTRRIVRQRPYTSQIRAAEWTPAVQVRDLTPFYVVPPTQYIRFGKWLARPGSHDKLLDRERVIVRELCHRDGRMTAALVRNGAIALHGIFTVVPQGIDAHTLTAVLNSQRLAEYVRVRAASFAKVDFQKITTAELRSLPIPAAAMSGPLARRLLALAHKAHKLGMKTGRAPATLTNQIELLVREMYDGVEHG